MTESVCECLYALIDGVPGRVWSHVHICEAPNDDTQLLRVNLDGTTVKWSGTRADATLDNLLQAMDENEIDKTLIIGLEGIVSNRSRAREKTRICGRV